jgi:hypothetical protein
VLILNTTELVSVACCLIATGLEKLGMAQRSKIRIALVISERESGDGEAGS